MAETAYDPYIKSGLTEAQRLGGKPGGGYTPFVSAATNGPKKTNMYDFNANAPLQQQAAPVYKGLMGGDYDKLQSALQQPGQQAAQNAYQQGSQNLNSTMSGQGLYGSSIMQQQQTQGLDREFQNASAGNASNAAAQRYQMEQAGLMDMNRYNAQETAGLRGQAMNTAQIGAQQADARNQYGTQQFNNDQTFNNNTNNWQNQQNYEQGYLQHEQQRTFNQDQNTRMLNESLALAGLAAPLQATAQNGLLQQQQINAQIRAANQQSTNALYGSVIGATGSIYGKNYDKINSGISGMFD